MSAETILIVSLLHDLCKTYYYTTDFKNQKTYDADKVSKASSREVKHDAKGNYIWETVPCFTVDNKYPLGHGSKSVVFILQYMKLSMEEITAITYHMGAYCDSSQWTELGQAYEKYPLALALHQADMEATHILEVEDGKKADFRKCQYSHCKHDDKTISIATEEYAEENGRYYHADCKHEKDTRAR